jgi:hypothetical protein
MSDAQPSTDLENRIRHALRARAAAFVGRADATRLRAVQPSADVAPGGLPSGVLDDALGVLRGTGPEYEVFGGRFCLANHGTMVAEALCAMGRDDAVLPWVERYRTRLSAPPAPIDPISPSEWRGALGDFARASDWTRFFEVELAQYGWTEVANRWIPRLAPGMYGGVHGAIRTAHAIRSVATVETPLRVHELAEGFAYWASQYRPLPESRGASAGLLPSAALRRVEQLDRAQRTGYMLFTQPIDRLQFLPSFAGVADLVDTDLDPSSFLSDLTEAVAAVLVTNVATVMPRGLSHALTGGAFARMMLGHVSTDATASALRYGWQLAAAFYAALVLEPPAIGVEAPAESVDDLFDEALACPDEHGIKVLEACLREHALNPSPVYLVAARETTRRLNVLGLNLY